MSAREVEVSHKIASVGIHIERVIGLLRNRYTILKGTIPLKLLKVLSPFIMDYHKLLIVQ